MDADGGADEIVVEEMLHAARRGLPAHVLDLPRLRPPSGLVRFRRVVVVARLGGPLRVHARVERPVRQVDAAHRVGQRPALERGRREPQAAVPRADAIARIRLAHPERQHALRPRRRRRFGVGHERGRAAELAVLRLAGRVEHRDGVAAPALDLAPVVRRSTRTDDAQGAGEIVLDDRAGGIQSRRRFGAAERADELLLRRIPRGLAAAGGTRELRQRDAFGHVVRLVTGSRSRSRASRSRPRPRASRPGALHRRAALTIPHATAPRWLSTQPGVDTACLMRPETGRLPRA